MRYIFLEAVSKVFINRKFHKGNYKAHQYKALTIMSLWICEFFLWFLWWIILAFDGSLSLYLLPSPSNKEGEAWGKKICVNLSNMYYLWDKQQNLCLEKNNPVKVVVAKNT